jgi:hypothetical protein
MVSIVADLKEQGLDAELQVQEHPRETGRVGSCMAAIRVQSPQLTPAHGSIVILASDDHAIKLLEFVQSRAGQGETTESSIVLKDLTEGRIRESVLTVVRGMLRK